MKPTHLDLFSGIGGFSLAFQAEGFRTIAHVEKDFEASLVLAGNFPEVFNLKDVTKLCIRAYDCETNPEDTEFVWCNRCNADFGDCECVGTDAFLDEYGAPDVITAGVPCQPASAIGQMRGVADERWLWPDTIRVVGQLMPIICNGMLFPQPPLVQGISEKESSCLLPTPTARDWKDTPGMSREVLKNGNVERDRTDQLPRRIYAHANSTPRAGIRLNPLFSLWLMGFPEGWLNPLYAAWETRLSRKSRKSSQGRSISN